MEMNGDRLAILQKRDAALQVKIAAEQDRLRKLEARLKEREFRIAGEACCKAARRDAAFRAALKAVLETEADQREIAFLRERGFF
jgi:hypothetical protein